MQIGVSRLQTIAPAKLARNPLPVGLLRPTPACSPALTAAGSGFQFDFQEHNLAGRLVEHIVLDAGFAEIGFSDG